MEVLSMCQYLVMKMSVCKSRQNSKTSTFIFPEIPPDTERIKYIMLRLKDFKSKDYKGGLMKE